MNKDLNTYPERKNVMLSVSKRVFIRFVSATLVVVSIFDLSAAALLASGPEPVLTPIKREFSLDENVMRPEMARAVAALKADLAYLRRYGKEKFDTRIMRRMDRDQEYLLKRLKYALTVYGPKKFVRIMLGWANPVIQQIVEDLLTFTMEAVYEGIEPFIRKALKRLKEELVRISAYYAELGLEKLIALLGKDGVLTGVVPEFGGKGHFEQFFSDSTVVKNFLIVAVSVSSIAVAIGISLSTGGVAPIVTVIGALVSLIGLIDGEGRVAEEALLEIGVR